MSMSPDEYQAEIDRLAAEVERLRAVRITVNTPNEVCDGEVTGTGGKR